MGALLYPPLPEELITEEKSLTTEGNCKSMIYFFEIYYLLAVCNTVEHPVSQSRGSTVYSYSVIVLYVTIRHFSSLGKRLIRDDVT